jgi:hypothetical protein
MSPDKSRFGLTPISHGSHDLASFLAIFLPVSGTLIPSKVYVKSLPKYVNSPEKVRLIPKIGTLNRSQSGKKRHLTYRPNCRKSLDLK